MEGINKRLQNKNFVDRAPKTVVEQEKINLAEPIASPDVRDFHLNALHEVIKGPSHKPHKSHKSHNYY